MDNPLRRETHLERTAGDRPPAAARTPRRWMEQRRLVLGALFLVCCPSNGLSTEEVQPGPKYYGMCDASAAAPLGNVGFVVANDEDNILRVYRRDRGGMPTVTFDMSAHLQPDAKRPETDIEGSTWLNRRIYWITSHGRNRKAKVRESRARLFATRIAKVNGTTTMLSDGEPYYDLLSELLLAPQLDRFKLREAAERAPKDKDGLNIEGLAATPSGELWIGFRNPIHKGRALVVPLLNPEEVIRVSISSMKELPSDRRARFGVPIELDLDGMGVRSIEFVQPLNEYLILAGPRAAGDVALYRWSGDRADSPHVVEGVQFGSLTPEAFVAYSDKHSISLQFMSDDGTRKINGTPCKTITTPEERRFRTMTWRGL